MRAISARASASAAASRSSLCVATHRRQNPRAASRGCLSSPMTADLRRDSRRVLRAWPEDASARGARRDRAGGARRNTITRRAPHGRRTRSHRRRRHWRRSVSSGGHRCPPRNSRGGFAASRNARELFARRTTTDALRYCHTQIRSTMKVLIKPRLQKDKWSVYWKTSMATRRLAAGQLQLDVDPEKVTGKELHASPGGHRVPTEKTPYRLEGFVEPWELRACSRFSLRTRRRRRASPGPTEARSFGPEAKISRPFDFPRPRRRPPTVLFDRSRRVYPKVADAKRSPSSSSPVHAPLVNARTTAISLSALPRREACTRPRAGRRQDLARARVTEERHHRHRAQSAHRGGPENHQEDDEDSDTEDDF